MTLSQLRALGLRVSLAPEGRIRLGGVSSLPPDVADRVMDQVRASRDAIVGELEWGNAWDVVPLAGDVVKPSVLTVLSLECMDVVAELLADELGGYVPALAALVLRETGRRPALVNIDGVNMLAVPSAANLSRHTLGMLASALRHEGDRK